MYNDNRITYTACSTSPRNLQLAIVSLAWLKMPTPSCRDGLQYFCQNDVKLLCYLHIAARIPLAVQFAVGCKGGAEFMRILYLTNSLSFKLCSAGSCGVLVNHSLKQSYSLLCRVLSFPVLFQKSWLAMHEFVILLCSNFGQRWLEILKLCKKSAYASFLVNNLPIAK